jgi:hypothetical protein
MELKFETFRSFCTYMHVECNVERSKNGDASVEYNRYLVDNLDFLYKEYERQNTYKKRKGMDG